MTTITQEIRQVMDIQKNGLSDIPPNWVLAAFNFFLALRIAARPNTRVSDFVGTAFHIEPTYIALGWAFVFLFSAWAALTAMDSRWGFRAAAFPLVSYIFATVILVSFSADAPSGGEVIALFALVYLAQNFEFRSESKATEDVLKAAYDEIAHLKKENAALKQTDDARNP